MITIDHYQLYTLATTRYELPCMDEAWDVIDEYNVDSSELSKLGYKESFFSLISISLTI